MSSDALLACGEPGVQLTWMDALVDGHVITPRIGKPVEVQALWMVRFWNEALGGRPDVVDDDHVAGAVDDAIRPNQIFALGGLPLALIDFERCRRALDVVESKLWTPMGLRTLDPAHPDYHGRYEGDRLARDAAYHQGTVWPWLTGAFVEAWVRSRESDPSAVAEAHERFVAPLLAHLDQAGIGHVSEIADGDAPHTSRGCPFQAWSVAELLRLEAEVLAGRAKNAMEGVEK
jgi:glycogen debranching enzyme